MDFGSVKRVTVFAGHYGSGKTNIAVNFALELKKHYPKVSIADLDIVNPYFRTKDASDILDLNGIKLISSPFANTNVDTPALPAEAYSVVHDKDVHAVIDVGGDDRGALALGRYSPYLMSENSYEMYFVINKYRYLTSSPSDTIEIMKEIEESANLKFTAIVNNSNIGLETSAQNIIDSAKYAQEVSSLSNLEVKMTSVADELYDDVKDKVVNAFPIKIYVSQSFLTRSNNNGKINI